MNSRAAVLGASIAVLAGCAPGPALRYESARPETATVLAGSIANGAGYSVSRGAGDESDDAIDVEWDYIPPYVTFAAWWRWAHGARWELSTGTDVDLGVRDGISIGVGTKLLVTPTDDDQHVHLAVSASLGGTFVIFPGLIYVGWAELGLPLTFEVNEVTSLTLRPQLRYGIGPESLDDSVHSVFTGGSFAVRHPCSETVDCVYELGVIGLVYPLSEPNSRQGFVQGSFGVGAVF